MSVSKPADQPSTFAEGVAVPASVEPTVEAVQAQVAAAPTREDRAREWGTYRAVADLRVGRSLAATAGGPVPASHPYLRDSDERGPGWVSQGGAVELVEGAQPPADLVEAHAAADAAKAAEAQSYPGGMYPGGSPA